MEGLPLKQQQQKFEIQQLWMPTTPAKTTPASSRRSQPSGQSWLEPALLVTNAIQLGSSTSSDHSNHLPPCPPLLVRFGNHQEIPVTQNMSPLEGKFFLDASLSNTSCCCCGNQKAEYGLPVALLPKFDSLPESALNVSKIVTMSAPPTPATTEKFYKTMPDEQLSLELTDIDEEGARVENLMAKDIIVLSKEASERLIRVQKSSIERKNNGIDLNLVSPKKRPQMKKHRPKVFEEGKPSRSPTPANPELETDEQVGRKDSTSCKRKYVRRKKDVNHFSDSASNAESKGETKSVRRCLNFDLEEQWAVNEFSAAMSMFKMVLGARALEECNESAVTSLSVKETADFVRDMAVKPSPDTISDLNGSTYQPNYECSKLSQVPTLPAKINKSMRSSIKEMPFLKSSVKHFKALARETACLDSASFSSQSSSEVTQRNLNPNKIAETPPKGTKRVHLSFDEAAASDQKTIIHSYNLRGCSSNAGTKDSSPTRIHKRIRIERWGHDEANPNASNGWDIKQLSNGSENFTVVEAPRFMVQEKMQDLERILAFNQTEGYVRNNLVSRPGEASLSSSRSSCRKSNLAKPSKQKNKDIIQPSTPKKLSKFEDTLENKIFGYQANLEISEETMNSLNTRIKTKHTFVEEWPSECSNGISSAQHIVEGGALSARSLNGKNFNIETFSVDSQSTCYYNVSAPSRLSLGTLVPIKNPVDDIVRKLRHLSIRSGDEVSSSQVQNSIVPYVDHGGIMTTYERNFHLIKRQRPRAKVDLDAESNRVWKLLMGKACSEGVERSDVDKEKWWDEERRIFRGRVDSFIARMHLVQGDRRFTQWKGSVVDSVVGVFLTQNVSDHLSSSAFMTLAANFPLSRRKYSVPNGEMVNTSTEIQNRCIMPFTDNPKLQSNLLDHGSFHCSLELTVSENGDQKENSNFSETHGSISTSSITYYSRQKGKGKSLNLQEKEAALYQESTVSVSGTADQAEMEDVKLHEDAITSQISACSSQNSAGFHVPSNKHIGSNSFLNIEADDYFSVNTGNDTLGSSSFTKLIQIAESCSFKEFYGCGRGMISATKNQETNFNFENNPTLWSQLDNSKDNLLDMSPPTESRQFVDPLNSKPMVNNANLLGDLRSHLLSTSCEIISSHAFEVMSRNYSESKETLAESTSLHKIPSSSKTATNIDSFVPIRKLTTQMEVGAMTSASYKNTAKAIIDVTKNENPNACSSLQTENVTIFHQKDGNSMFQGQRAHNTVQAPDQLEKCRTQQTAVSNNEIKHSLDVVDKAGPNPKSETCSFPLVSPEKSDRAPNARKRRSEIENNSYDWESLRKELCCTKPAKERNSTTMDSVDWEAVRIADVSKISESIRERGMNNVLAERIKEFLNRLVREHGRIDLEWLRDFPPDKVKDYLLSIRGLGLKSVECVRLLTLQNLAFPVDTNVGRICVRLGWVPLQPLPESLQLHLLELYPVLETIQKYLWPRLCKLDQRTLYELHYQMITFGKVFCTKRKPNCNSCPMRGECKHFASAFASARLALPAPEDKSVMSFTTIIASQKSHSISINPTPLPQLEGGSNSCTFRYNYEPIIEEPASPEPECPEALESAIEDAFYEDPDEIPTIKLNLEEFTQNLRNYMEENMELQDGSLSKALVALTPEAASIPMPKLKNVSRLRTEHQVYEIPDKHPLLEGVDPREPDDPSPYLLAIWTPGETAQSTEPPKACCNSQDPNQLCERSTCFACSSIQEAEFHNVRGTLLIPCRTAMRGSFPLNGTYFQVNEVFADHHSSCDPIYVPRDWIWNLPRRTVFFGTSIPTIFRGLTTEGIQQCFWRGFVCVRGFDRVTRAPKPLYARLHFPASKAPKNKKAAEPKVEN